MIKPYEYIYDIWSFLLFIEHTSWCKSNQVSVLPNNTINFILMIIDYGIHLSSFSLDTSIWVFYPFTSYMSCAIKHLLLSIIHGIFNCTSCTWTKHLCGRSKIWLLKSFISDPLQNWLNYTWIRNSSLRWVETPNTIFVDVQLCWNHIITFVNHSIAVEQLLSGVQFLIGTTVLI